MARPKCVRQIENVPGATYFKPRGVPLKELEEVVITKDELEALRLADRDGLYQESGALSMGVSRPTFGRILESARKKIADALTGGKAIKIEGGVVEMVRKRIFECLACGHRWEEPFGTGRPGACPQCSSKRFQRADNDRGPGRGRGAGRCRQRGKRV